MKGGLILTLLASLAIATRSQETIELCGTISAPVYLRAGSEYNYTLTCQVSCLLFLLSFVVSLRYLNDSKRRSCSNSIETRFPITNFSLSLTLTKTINSTILCHYWLVVLDSILKQICEILPLSLLARFDSIFISFRFLTDIYRIKHNDRGRSYDLRKCFI